MRNVPDLVPVVQATNSILHPGGPIKVNPLGTSAAGCFRSLVMI